MEVSIKYGSQAMPINIKEQNLAGILSVQFPGVPKPEEAIAKALNNPINRKTLEEIAREKRPKKIVIVVTDISRPVPHSIIIPPILQNSRKQTFKKVKFIS
nr:lactate racemase domain-containing protein [Desulforamulus aquiferis]